jgi:dimethylaniline monooxygenase (N-oxide forming)
MCILGSFTNVKLSSSENLGSSRVLSTPGVDTIPVLGGGKFAADMVYSDVKAGREANWALKATETTGPGFFLSPEEMAPYKMHLRLL